MSEEIKKVTKEKNPNRVAAGKKSYETHMIKLKEDILSGSSTSNTPNTPSDTSNASNATSNATSNTSNNATTKSSSYVAHMYGVGILSILAVGLCVFYYYSDDIKGDKKKKDSTATTTTVSTKENIIHRQKML